MNKVKLGLAGCGSRGISVTRLFTVHPECEVVALMDPFESCIANAADKLSLEQPKTYRDFDRMLTDARLDAVFIAGDPTVQVDIACRAMERGIHVCTEVPAAVTIRDCRKLVETVENTGCKYQLMEQTRYWGFIQEWSRRHRRGEFGHVCLAQGEYVHFHKWGNWTDRETGEIYSSISPPEDRDTMPHWRYRMLADPIYYLPHTLSPILEVLDDRVVRVSCMGTRKRSYTYPDEELPWSDIQYAVMHTEKDTVVLAGAGFSLPHARRGPTRSHWYEIRGVRASVSSPHHDGDKFHVWREGTESYGEEELSTVPLDAEGDKAETGHGGADFKPVDTFIRSIIGDTVPPMDVYRSVETAAPAILAAESAGKNGMMLEVPDFRIGR